jgi:cytochrome c oxidase assembly protein subunit 15
VAVVFNMAVRSRSSSTKGKHRLSSPTANNGPSHPPHRRRLHLWTLLTALLVFPLLLSGGTVTSLQVGMADPEWPSPPWYMLVLLWTENALVQGTGFLIEHGHRQLGWIVGLMTIVLALAYWRWEERPGVRWLGLATLPAVGIQGILGGVRVLYNAPAGPELAMIHGFTGQVVFCLFAALILLTSRKWQETAPLEVSGGERWQRLCLLTALLIVLQLVLGVALRHVQFDLTVQLLLAHVAVALAVVAHVIILTLRLGKYPGAFRQVFRRPVWVLGLAVLVQVALGVGAWWWGAGNPTLKLLGVIPPARALFATAHVGMGAVVLAAAVVLTLQSFRFLVTKPMPAALPLGASGGTS